MPPVSSHNRLIVAAGLLWATGVLTSYYVANSGYYIEKVTLFARLLIRAL